MRYQDCERDFPAVPCKGQCLYYDYGLVNGTCIPNSMTYTCGITRQFQEDPCEGKCLPGRVLLKGKCILQDETLICNGKLQQIKEPCNGNCPSKKIEEEYDRYEYQKDHGNLSLYVLCGNECLRRDSVWECNGQCQHYSVPCNQGCFYYNHYRSRYGYFNGQCLRVRPRRRVGGGRVPIYTGPVSGVSVSRSSSKLELDAPPNHTGPVNGVSVLRSRSKLECTRLECKTQYGCCLLVKDPLNGKLICPTRC